MDTPRPSRRPAAPQPGGGEYTKRRAVLSGNKVTEQNKGVINYVNSIMGGEGFSRKQSLRGVGEQCCRRWGRPPAGASTSELWADGAVGHVSRVLTMLAVTQT